MILNPAGIAGVWGAEFGVSLTPDGKTGGRVHIRTEMASANSAFRNGQDGVIH